MVDSRRNPQDVQDSERANPFPIAALVALALGSFAIGCTEFAAVALLPQVAVDLGVSQALSGQLVTLNALAVVIAAPVLGAVFAGAPARMVVVCSLAAFAVAHVVAAVSGSFVIVAATRLLSGASFGLFLAVAFAVATRLASRARRATAMAIVQSGITASTALGIPAGLALGRAGGDSAGWRLPFLIIAALAVIAAVVTVVLVPRLEGEGDASKDARSRMGVLRRGRVLLGLATTTVFWGGSFAGLTYLIPYLEDEVGLTLGAAIGVLLLAGALSVVGNFLGGILADRSPEWALIGTASGAVLGIVLLFAFDSVAVVITGLALWQLSTWSFVPVIQARVFHLGQDQGEAAVSYAVAAFNLGIVAGAALGGLALGFGGFAAVGAVSVVFALAAVGLGLLVNRVLAGDDRARAS